MLCRSMPGPQSDPGDSQNICWPLCGRTFRQCFSDNIEKHFVFAYLTKTEARKGKVAEVRELLVLRADIRQKNCQGLTALELARSECVVSHILAAFEDLFMFYLGFSGFRPRD